VEIGFTLDSSGNRIGVPVEPVSAHRPDDSVLTGRRVHLEHLGVEHSRALWDAFAATESTTLWTYMPQGPFASEADQREWIERVSTSADPFFYAIVDNTTNLAVGISSYLRIDEANGVIEVGYLSFSGALQRTPAATEAMYLMANNASRDTIATPRGSGSRSTIGPTGSRTPTKRGSRRATLMLREPNDSASATSRLASDSRRSPN
jgi:RimJ/RimL family protein N-acetyltransferase